MDFQIKYKRNVGRENVQKNSYYIKTDKYLNDFFFLVAFINWLLEGNNTARPNLYKFQSPNVKRYVDFS